MILQKIKTEEEYFKQFKLYKKKLNKLTRGVFKFINNPTAYTNEFENILKEMVYIDLVTIEWADEQRKKLYSEMGKPQEFKNWCGMTKDQLIFKIKKKLGKV